MERTLLAFYYGDIDALGFSEWLLTRPAADALPKPLYDQLLPLDYSDTQETEAARQLIRRHVEGGGSSMPLERARDALEGLFERGMSLESTFKVLADLRMQGYESIPIEFVGLSSEFDRLGVEPYRERAMAEASVLRTKLTAQSDKRAG